MKLLENANRRVLLTAALAVTGAAAVTVVLLTAGGGAGRPLALDGSGGAARADGAVAAADEPVIDSEQRSGTAATENSRKRSKAKTKRTELAAGGVVGKYTERVYVPNSDANTVSVVNPRTFQVVGVFPVGALPHHVTPSYDLTKLYALNTSGNQLTVINPGSGKPTKTIRVPDPYNLYFTPDGTQAIVVAERERRLDFRNPETWELIKSVPVRTSGVDHLAFSLDGSYLLASAEFSGYVVKISTHKHKVMKFLEVGGEPIDVLRHPDRNLMFVANQSKGGVHVIDAGRMEQIGFIRTGRGAHGLLLSRDKTAIYASNRLAGTISVINVASRTVVDTWDLGDASPDMGMLNPDGTQLWISGRYHGMLYALDTENGQVLARIRVGAGAHGVSYFPTAGDFSIGHNGIMIDAEERDRAVAATRAFRAKQKRQSD